MFELLEHAADTGFRVRGLTKAELFANAAMALESIALDPADVRPLQAFPLAVTGEDDASLLVNWLSEVLYHLDGPRVALCRFCIDEITATMVRAQAWGEPRDPLRHPARLVVKGVTYHQLKIEKDSEGWRAEVFLDI